MHFGKILFAFFSQQSKQTVRSESGQEPIFSLNLSSEREADEEKDIIKPGGASGVGFHDARQALRKDLPGALHIGAEEAADM